MSAYIVEAQMTSVSDGDWSKLRGVTDTVPGTILIEDAESPLLILPVTASTPGRAGMFVEGVFTLAGVKMVSAIVEPSDEDAEIGPADDTTTEAQVRSWIERVPPVPA